MLFRILRALRESSLDYFANISLNENNNAAQTSGDLRLVGSSNRQQGRLEIYLSGQWGTVCDDGFGLTEANVACRQLGYPSAFRYGSVGALG